MQHETTAVCDGIPSTCSLSGFNCKTDKEFQGTQDQCANGSHLFWLSSVHSYHEQGQQLLNV